MLDKLQNSRNGLGLLFILPAAVLLLLFLTYPLGLGVWLGFTDAKVGRSGAWIGAGAVVNQGTEQAKRIIGQDTVIGSGAVVTRDCEAHAVYAGVPARKIK